MGVLVAVGVLESGVCAHLCMIFRVRVTSRARSRVRGGSRFRVRVGVRVKVLMEVGAGANGTGCPQHGGSNACRSLLLVVQISPNDPSNIPSLFAVEVCQSPHRVCSNDDAAENISFMLVTLDTSHLLMSTLNDEAVLNIPSMLVTLATSHFEMSLLNDDAE